MHKLLCTLDLALLCTGLDSKMTLKLIQVTLLSLSKCHYLIQAEEPLTCLLFYDKKDNDEDSNSPTGEPNGGKP